MMGKALYQELCEAFTEQPDITRGRKTGFGSGLRVNGKIFAMPAKEHLALKLPEARIAELEATSVASPYMHSGGKPSKGWCVINADSFDIQLPLAQEACEYARNSK